jgi:hypothetical protein
MHDQNANQRTYSTCHHCTAKWFDDEQRQFCPRCGSAKVLHTTESVPWNGRPPSNPAPETVPPASNSTATVPPTSTRQLSQLPDPCTSAQLAVVLGKSPKTIVDWCQERAYTLIPCFRLGNRWYHRVPELVRWLNGIKSGHIKFRRKPRRSSERS